MRRSRAAVVSAIALLTASLLVGTASPAQAAPSGCWAWQEYYARVFSRCTSGTGTQAVHVYGIHINPMNGPWTVTGPRVGVGETSEVNFPGNILTVTILKYD
ncbi:hypothetical protein [Spongiactinospora sp. TRM90649]|uniref:hypothetical protein n=1 Tax=Spongiactinospora sp. TRM90649 TaxID=3031114 RepID=UPI0023F91B7B|nr:hypothetical protein [Spongiactinospora sp. TRM90649]MDF5758050.1 hypothetical protein [Spongiactinospora sp. TRM90649]